MKIEDIINREELNERLDGDIALYRELADLFINDSDKLIGKIEDAVNCGDGPAIRKAAHTIKGSVANFSAKNAYDAAFELENIGRNLELNKAQSALQKLKDEVTRAKEAIVLLKNENSIT